MLLTTYRDQGDFAAAERVAAELVKENPTDAGARRRPGPAGRRPGDRGRPARGDRAEAEAARRPGRRPDLRVPGRFKADPTFTQLDCELEIRRGDTTQALALTQEIDAQAKGSPVGPLLRAQIFAAEGPDPRGRRRLRRGPGAQPQAPRGPAPARPAQPPERPGRRGDPPGPVPPGRRPRQAHRPAALLVEARALASQTGTAAQVQANRAQAVEKLAGAIKARPDFADAYHLTAEIHLLSGDRPRAVAALKRP